jgi:hypothetical protein
MTIENMPAQQARAASGDDPRGWLVFDGPLPNDLARQEDSRAFADYDMHKPRGFERPAVDCERALLAHLGFTVPDDLVTVVRYRTRGVRCRTWPQLETAQEASTP